ncbi:hypothetical protein AB4224_02845 [Vibrio lentus]
MKNQLVWRYLDLAKFIGLLQRDSLYLSRADKFNDPFEGVINRATHEAIVEHLDMNLGDKNAKASYVRFYDQWIGYSGSVDKTEAGKAIFDTLNWLKTYTYVNCWHSNSHESEAMWKLYSKNIEESLVIKTTTDKLLKALPQDVRLEEVIYKDYESQFVMESYFLGPFKTKRVAFSHEKEIRIIKQEPPLKDFNDNYKQFDQQKTNTESGKEITLTGGVLGIIEEIRLSPLAPVWFENLVKDLLIKYDVNIPVYQSEISIKPYEI